LRLSTPQEIQKLLVTPGAFAIGDIEKAQRRAVIATELITGEPLRRLTHEEHIVWSGITLFAKTFPIRSFKVGEFEADADLRTGAYTLDRPPGSYDISYTVGYDEESYPAILNSLVTNLTIFSLVKNEERRLDAQNEIQVIRELRKRVHQQRGTYRGEAG
jgi:hypothetical protein